MSTNWLVWDSIDSYCCQRYVTCGSEFAREVCCGILQEFQSTTGQNWSWSQDNPSLLQGS